jgi:hypothetical protein
VKIRPNPFFPKSINELAHALGVYWRELALFINGLLPDQAGNNGKYLKTDGTNASWEAVSSGATLTVSEEGTLVAADITELNFVGAAITATNPSSGVAEITADPDILMADTADILTAGFATTDYNAGTKSSGTFTPNEANGNLQYIVNGGAFTLAPPTNAGTMILQITNNASAGAITTSGWTKVTNAAPALTDGNDYLAYIVKINGFSHLTWIDLQ